MSLWANAGAVMANVLSNMADKTAERDLRPRRWLGVVRGASVSDIFVSPVVVVCIDLSP